MTTWRDVYDDPEGMACALDTREQHFARRGEYDTVALLSSAAACIRDLAERIAELEAQPTPAPSLPWTSIGVWSMEQGRDDPVPVLRMRGEDELAALIEHGVGDIDYEVMVRPADGSTLSGQPALEQEVEGDRGELINAIREAREEIEDVRDRLPEDEVILDTIHGADQALEDCERYLFDCARADRLAIADAMTRTSLAYRQMREEQEHLFGANAGEVSIDPDQGGEP